MPRWADIQKIAEFAFEPIDDSYPDRARRIGKGKDDRPSGHAIVGGLNDGQESSRENAGLAPRHLGLEVVLARSFARIHRQNLIDVGVLPLTFAGSEDHDRLEIGDTVEIRDVAKTLAAGPDVTPHVRGREITLRHDHTARQIELLRVGGVINRLRERTGRAARNEPERTVA